MPDGAWDAGGQAGAERGWWWLPLGSALVVLAAGSAGLVGAPFRLDTDDLAYLGMAWSHASGAGLVAAGEFPPAGTHFPPGWPLILSWFFAAGVTLPTVIRLASGLSLTCLASATAIWAVLFRRRLGAAWGAVAAVWCAVAFPSLLAGSSASAEGPACLVTALVAWLVSADAGPGRISLRRRALLLGAALAALALLRTQLLLLWPLALWEARLRLTRRQQVIALALAAGLFGGANLLTASPPGSGYLAETWPAWRGGAASVGAAALRGNLTENVWGAAARLTISPLPYSGIAARWLGSLGIRALAVAVCLGLAWAAWRERRRGLPPMAAAPLALALPFLLGYPYVLTPRFLLPAGPVLGFLTVVALRRALRGAPRLALTAAVVWLAIGVAWWVRLAPRYREEQRVILADAGRTAEALIRQHRWGSSLCLRDPEVLWAVTPDARACRFETMPERLLPPAERAEAVHHHLERAGARCVVQSGTGQEGDSAPLPLAAWGYRPTFVTGSFSTWCRP
jgi:hypothetical protein